MLELKNSLSAVFNKKAADVTRTISSLVEEIEKHQDGLSLESESLSLVSALDKIEHPADIKYLKEIEDVKLKESLSLESAERIHSLKERIISSIGQAGTGEDLAFAANLIERKIAKTAYDLGTQIKIIMKRPLPDSIILKSNNFFKPIFLFDGLSYSKENLVKTENILGNNNEFSILTSWIVQQYSLGNGVNNFGNELQKFFTATVSTLSSKVKAKGTSGTPEDVEEMEKLVESIISELSGIEASMTSSNPYTRLIMDGSKEGKFTYKGKFSTIETDGRLRSQSQTSRFNERALIAFMGPALGKALSRGKAKGVISEYFDSRNSIPSRLLKINRSPMSTSRLLEKLPGLEFQIELNESEIEVLNNMLKDTIHRVDTLFNLLSDIKNAGIPFLREAYTDKTKTAMLIFSLYAGVVDSSVGVILKELSFQLHLAANLVEALYPSH